MAKKKTNEKMGIRICGKFTVWGSKFSKNGSKKEFRYAYSTSIGERNDGEWENLYIDVVFPKADEINFEGVAKVNVKDGFVTFYTKESGERRIKIVLLDYTFIEEE